MDIYNNKSRWKILLALIGAAIVIISMVYSQYLAKKLAERELMNVNIYKEALVSILDDPNNVDEEFALASDILSTLEPTIPLILESESGELKGLNVGGMEECFDQKLLIKKVEDLVESGFTPIKGVGYANFIYYEHSRLYHLIRWFPLAQILLLGTFIFFSYFLFSASRKSEQNRVWAGMAKETAHQLGTPISAIIGWIEHLKDLQKDDPDSLEVVEELRNDVKRLELIADRFSKIGSKPDLKTLNIIDTLNQCKNYMQRRAPSKVKFDFPLENTNPISVKINEHLFEWVLENLMRNALDAMGAEGTISSTINASDSKCEITLSDTGKGIPASEIKKVFNPGFTTKKRGWGLGLSLAKRIIENYHDGKIFVKNSKIDEGTTFAIILPLA